MLGVPREVNLKVPEALMKIEDSSHHPLRLPHLSIAAGETLDQMPGRNGMTGRSDRPRKSPKEAPPWQPGHRGEQPIQAPAIVDIIVSQTQDGNSCAEGPAG